MERWQLGRGQFALGAALRIAIGFATWVAGGCASFESDRHLAPLYTEISRAGGGTEVEALGGAIRVRHVSPGGPLEQFALRPIVIVDKTTSGDTLSHFLTPLGTSRLSAGYYTWQLL